MPDGLPCLLDSQLTLMNIGSTYISYPFILTGLKVVSFMVVITLMLML